MSKATIFGRWIVLTDGRPFMRTERPRFGGTDPRVQTRVYSRRHLDHARMKKRRSSCEPNVRELLQVDIRHTYISKCPRYSVMLQFRSVTISSASDELFLVWGTYSPPPYGYLFGFFPSHLNTTPIGVRRPGKTTQVFNGPTYSVFLLNNLLQPFVTLSVWSVIDIVACTLVRWETKKKKGFHHVAQ